MNISKKEIETKYKDIPKIVGILAVLMGVWKTFDFYSEKSDAIIRKVAKQEAERYYKEKEAEFTGIINDLTKKKIYSPMYDFAEHYRIIDSVKVFLPSISKIHNNTRIIINVKVLDKATGKMYFIDGYGNEYPIYRYQNGELKGKNTYIDENLNIVP